MKHRLVALFLLLPWAVLAQDAISKSLRADWQRTRKQLVDLAEAMPEDKFGFKPTPEQRTFGEQLAHLATSNLSYMHRIAGTKPTAETHAATRAEILKLLTESFDFGDTVLAKLTDAAAVEPVKVGAGETTRLRLAIGAITNSFNHYGQLVTYLRLNGIVPPASRPRPKS